jgi:hypothetical protein
LVNQSQRAFMIKIIRRQQRRQERPCDLRADGCPDPPRAERVLGALHCARQGPGQGRVA